MDIFGSLYPYKSSVGITAAHEFSQFFNNITVSFLDALGIFQIFGLVEIFDADQAHKVQVGVLVIEREINESAERVVRIEVIENKRLLKFAYPFVGFLKDCDIQTLLAAEIIVDHPFRRRGAGADLVYAGAGKAFSRKLDPRFVKDLALRAFRVASALFLLGNSLIH